MRRVDGTALLVARGFWRAERFAMTEETSECLDKFALSSSSVSAGPGDLREQWYIV